MLSILLLSQQKKRLYASRSPSVATCHRSHSAGCRWLATCRTDGSSLWPPPRSIATSKNFSAKVPEPLGRLWSAISPAFSSLAATSCHVHALLCLFVATQNRIPTCCKAQAVAQLSLFFFSSFFTMATQSLLGLFLAPPEKLILVPLQSASAELEIVCGVSLLRCTVLDTCMAR